jgi:hypothetical protein
VALATADPTPRGHTKKAVIIRFNTDEEVRLITSAAHAMGVSREEFLRMAALRDAQQPIIRPQYSLWAWGSGNKVKVTRDELGKVNVYKTGKPLTATQQAAVEQAEQAMKRNGRGDREAAIGALHKAFEDVEERTG